MPKLAAQLLLAYVATPQKLQFTNDTLHGRGAPDKGHTNYGPYYIMTWGSYGHRASFKGFSGEYGARERAQNADNNRFQ